MTIKLFNCTIKLQDYHDDPCELDNDNWTLIKLPNYSTSSYVD